MKKWIVIEYGPQITIVISKKIEKGLYMYVCAKNGKMYDVITSRSEYYDLYDIDGYKGHVK